MSLPTTHNVILQYFLGFNLLKPLAKLVFKILFGGDFLYITLSNASKHSEGSFMRRYRKLCSLFDFES